MATPQTAVSPLEVPPRDQARHTRRRIILQAAEEIFATRGFRGATMSEIAARAGYSAGNLYNVFENKEALFAHVLSSRAGNLLGVVRSALASSADISEAVDRYVDVMLEFVRKHSGFFAIITHTHLDFDWHDPRTLGADVREEFDRDLEKLFASAVEKGDLAPASPRTYLCLVQGTLNSYVARWVREGGDAGELTRTAGEIKQLIKRALGVAR
jgi:AcrR family transcriptional regulator